ncbi:MAG: rhomboid family intramembrane serine protease [Woeseiaceae bacterium]|nr:rhomboid family intramembrane serine protease [Woeseiaceae bacterium]
MNQYQYQQRVRPPSAIPNVILGLLIANGLLFALQQLTFEPKIGIDLVTVVLGLWPATESGSPFGIWQLFTYGFLHGNLPHLAFNMFALWMFGRDLERLMGAKKFFTYYMACVVGAGIVQLIVAAMQGGLYPTVGASGGVFGILLAYGMSFPNRMVMLIIPPIPMRAKYFVIMIGLFELYLGFSGRSPGVANFAHLGGMLFGFLLLKYWQKDRRR